MESENAAKELEPTILYEDDDVLVVNKPVGLMAHDDGRSKESTLVDWFLARYPEASGVGEKGETPDGVILERSGIVHRLDRDTSGVMVLVKRQTAFNRIKSQFHDRLAKKEYRAFVYGTMKERWGTIDRQIGRSARDFRLRSAQRGAKGTLRDALTEWELIGQNKQYAYLKLFPKTGRTHQIRVHLKAIGHPVIGDRLYAPKNQLETDSLGFGRLALHAYRLDIDLPTAGPKEFIAPLDSVFEAAEVTLSA